MRYIVIELVLLIVLITPSCNKDGVIYSPLIKLDNPEGVYTTKVGREVTIVPSYENADEGRFEWAIDGIVVGKERSYTFIPDRAGEYFISITVTTDFGSDTEELRVDVFELEIPTVSMANAAAGYTVVQNSTLSLNASVRDCSIPTTYSWKVNGEEVSQSLSYSFLGKDLGLYNISFSAENEDGYDSIEFQIRVCSKEDIPFSWEFERTNYHLSSGRRIKIAPTEIINGDNAKYEWSLDDKSVEGINSPFFVFDLEEVGKHCLTLSATIEQADGVFAATQLFNIEVFPKEGTFKREKTASSLSSQTTVFEYTAAPGQFVNEPKSGFSPSDNTPEAAAAYALKRMQQSLYVSLGGFGGYVVVGFDHSINNSGGYDIAIQGNSFDGSSEPGIVWVMQDENGNGEPDDNWYELKGCEDDYPETIKEYAVTYYRPSGIGMPVQWSDNLGNSGEIDYLKAYHTQDYYYPAWINEDSYTLRGTRLKARNYDRSGNGTYWIQPEYEWGYVDNYSPVDLFKAEGHADGNPISNHFKISNAIDWEGKPVNLKYVDFIKVQTALNTKSGWLGENSTEVFGFFDCNM